MVELCVDYQVVDAGRDLDAVFADVQAIAEETIRAKAEQPIDYLK